MIIVGLRVEQSTKCFTEDFTDTLTHALNNSAYRAFSLGTRLGQIQTPHATTLLAHEPLSHHQPTL